MLHEIASPGNEGAAASDKKPAGMEKPTGGMDWRGSALHVLRSVHALIRLDHPDGHDGYGGALDGVAGMVGAVRVAAVEDARPVQRVDRVHPLDASGHALAVPHVRDRPVRDVCFHSAFLTKQIPKA